MTNNSNTHRDINTPDENPQSNSVEVVRSTGLMHALNTLNDAVMHDRPVTQKMMNTMRHELQNIMMAVGGENMTIEQMRKIPDLQKNKKIWDEILSGDYKNIKEMTAMTDKIAEVLSESNYADLFLTEVKDMTNEQIKILAKFTGGSVWTGLPHLTDEQAEIFAAYKCQTLGLNRLQHCTHRQIELLTGFKGKTLSFSMTHLTDELARALAKFGDTEIELYHLRHITDTCAEYLAPIRNKIIYPSDELKQQLDAAASRLGLT